MFGPGFGGRLYWLKDGTVMQVSTARYWARLSSHGEPGRAERANRVTLKFARPIGKPNKLTRLRG